ncbi:hypothetical protein M409DRAFT_60138 [Zasmidium cellare ATCC 36951]|uniref:Uncharacterized protein n=1 Tax=Zasmidium cellare ATCC 36951 TaxID=1080233 RepID=A0A6A6C224_ZASCE|nr:uncharacterized protein M409DRAFT_60138 [Zasmidium cellare ATCC 36951]KAF2160220.1 hypothetical protein M409DRAFT_60138 [Zasmidium cellare ATCC 36951]
MSNSKDVFASPQYGPTTYPDHTQLETQRKLIHTCSSYLPPSSEITGFLNSAPSNSTATRQAASRDPRRTPSWRRRKRRGGGGSMVISFGVLCGGRWKQRTEAVDLASTSQACLTSQKHPLAGTPEEVKGGATPQYGPPMSPAIFSEKWYAKFEELLATSFFCTREADATWIADVCEAGYEHLFNFHAQAAELDLQEGDLPKPHAPKAAVDSETEPSSPRAMAAQVRTASPFYAAATLLDMVHPFLCRLQSMKLGKRMHGISWQQLPLSVRQRINELMLKVEDAKKAKWWSLSETQEKRLVGELGEYEARWDLQYRLRTT